VGLARCGTVFPVSVVVVGGCAGGGVPLGAVPVLSLTRSYSNLPFGLRVYPLRVSRTCFRVLLTFFEDTFTPERHLFTPGQRLG